jgi:hypothetical protein
VGGAVEDRAPFGAPAPTSELVAALRAARPGLEIDVDDTATATEVVVQAMSQGDLTAVQVLAYAHGWAPAGTPEPAEVRFCPAIP